MKSKLRSNSFFRALDVLRSGQNVTSLIVCRVDSNDRDTGGAGDRKISIGRSFSHAGVLGASEHLDNDSSNHIRNYGEFSVTLTKVKGSLGFTLSRSDSAPFLEDGARLRHSVKALGRCSLDFHFDFKLIKEMVQNKVFITHCMWTFLPLYTPYFAFFGYASLLNMALTIR